MKQTIKSILAIAMILCMLFTVVGCGGNGDVESDEQVAADDSFFTDEATQNEKEETEKDDTTSNGKDTDSDNDGSTTVIPDANKVGGKSWKDVLASMPKKLRGKTITMYNWSTANSYTGAPEVIEKFTKQTGIKVKWQNVTYNNYFTKLTALVASGKGIPDVVKVPIYQVSMLKDLQPLSVTGYDFSDEAWDKNLMNLYTYGSNTYAANLMNTHIGTPTMMFYNKGLIEKHNMEDPYQLWKAGKWTWNKYIEMCREFRELVPTGTPITSGEGFFEVYALSFGYGGTIAYNGKQFYNPMKEDKFLEVYQLLGDFYNKEHLFDFGSETRMNEQGALFSIGIAAHLRKKSSYYGNIKSANNFYAVPMPSIEGQETYYQGLREIEAYGIPKGAPTPEAVPYFLRFFLDGANYTLSNYFCNEQNLEVYNWCMNQPNIIASYGHAPSVAGVGEDGIMSKTGAQMKNFIDANSGSVDKTIKEYNDIIATLK